MYSRFDLVRKLAFATVVAGMLPAGAQAALITPTGVAASSFHSDAVHPLRLINDTSVTGASTSIGASGGTSGMWHAGARGSASTLVWGGGNTAPVVAGQNLVFTLPGTYDVSQADIWQMNQTGNYGRGTKQYDLSVSSDGVNYTPVITDDLLSIASGDVTAQTKSFTTQSGVRFVKLNIDTAQNGNTNEYVGLTEVRFEGTKTANGPILTTKQGSNTGELGQSISNSDFLEGKLPTTFSLQSGSAPISGLTNGVGAGNSDRVIPLDANSVSQILYTDTQLGLAANQTLNISKINLFSYSSDGRRNTDFDVLYTLDGSTWQYAFIGAANSITTGSGNFKLSSLARDDSADFLTGVRGLRFDLRPVNYTLQSGVIEIDVFGVAVPEPSSLAMMLFGTIALWVVGRKRQ